MRLRLDDGRWFQSPLLKGAIEVNIVVDLPLC